MISGTTGLLIIVAVMLIVIIRRQLRQRAARESDVMAASAQELQLQLEETADRIIKRMGNHVDHLEVLIAEADEKIALFDEKIRRWESLSQVAETSDSCPAAKGQADSRRTDALAECSVPGFFGAAQRENEQERLPRKLSGVHEKVATMLKNGKTMDEIARETGLGKGAIFLIQEMAQTKKPEEL